MWRRSAWGPASSLQAVQLPPEEAQRPLSAVVAGVGWYVRFDVLLGLLAVASVCAWSFVCAATEFDGSTYQAHTTAQKLFLSLLARICHKKAPIQGAFRA